MKQYTFSELNQMRITKGELFQPLKQEEQEPIENPSCPACDGIGIPLGNLGSIAYFRCESCGMTFSGDHDE